MSRVLLVDDERDTRELLKAALAREGFEVHCAADGVEARSIFDDGFDVIVTDLVMPRLDGIGLLREVVPRNRSIIPVVMSSFADKDRTIAALNLGARFLIEKPFSSADLVRCLQRLLAERDEVTDLRGMVRRRLSEFAMSDRDRQLITYVLKGLSNTSIARVIGVSEQSVKNSLFNLYRNLGICSRSQLFHLVFPV